MTLKTLARDSLLDLANVFAELSEATAQLLIDELSKARRIAIYGVGREGLMMKAFAMRLFHMGLEVHVVGDMTTPPVTKGDLLLVSCGPGWLSTVIALMEVAKEAGARVAVITSQPQSEAAKLADSAIFLPAQTMASDQAQHVSVLPMGSLFEFSQFLFFELIVLLLRERLGISAEAMRERHTNLE
jgi:6-phospho-3-hexuloisomerase